MAELKLTLPIREVLGSLIKNSKERKLNKKTPNAFILFRKVCTQELSLRNCHMKANEISKLSSEYWKILPDVIKYEFKQISEELRDNALNKTSSKKIKTSKYKFKSETPNSFYRKTTMRTFSNSKSRSEDSNHSNNSKNPVINNDTVKDVSKSEIMENLSASLDSSEINAEIMPELPFLQELELTWQQSLTSIPPFNDVLDEGCQSFLHKLEYNMSLDQSDINDNNLYHDYEDQLLELLYQPNLTAIGESQFLPYTFGNNMDLDQFYYMYYYH
ncbi:13733_t:CDS:1 [Ambispora leptoticha]|uniref:13733_t:CDS:1 n=1 Tax=Ambispora leptoticha TaxID=144679 RepID=A0A9N8ZHI9_9GLOM|nr:13733_t:CDS:1 [Ambispora leptoticha]